MPYQTRFTHSDITSDARFAAQVERYHTWPVLRKQTVGEHTWQVMRIWYQIFGPLQASESEYLLWHDAGELLTGDPPGFVKQASPPLKAIYDELEEKAVRAMNGPNMLISENTRVRAKVCDLLDVYEFCLVEKLQGNRLIEGGILWARATLATFLAKLPRGDFDMVLDHIRIVNTRYGE
jgi:5'-deoxynucleotidase YfbR-like HD superfamily hydrolase